MYIPSKIIQISSTGLRWSNNTDKHLTQQIKDHYPHIINYVLSKALLNLFHHPPPPPSKHYPKWKMLIFPNRRLRLMSFVDTLSLLFQTKIFFLFSFFYFVPPLGKLKFNFFLWIIFSGKTTSAMAWQGNKPKPWQPRNLQNITKTRITNKVNQIRL